MNNGSIIFQSAWHPALILSIISVCCIFFMWREYRRPYRFRFFRGLSVLLFWVSLGGMVLKPAWSRKVSTQGVLLTKGYEPKAVDSLLNKHPQTEIFRTSTAAPYRAGEQVIDPDHLPQHEIPFGTIIGEGLNPATLDRFDSVNFSFIPAPPGPGIQEITLPDAFTSGKAGSIQGVIRNRTRTTINLVGPGSPEDSMVIDQSGVHPFKLSFMPKVPGRFIYTLKVKDDEGTSIDQIPVVVEAPRALRIFIFQEFPTAETRHLKNLLAGQGHELTIRYQVSKTAYRYEYANRKPVRIDRLTPALLAEADLIICNAGAVDSMTDPESSALERAIQEGLGCLILLDDIPSGKYSGKLTPVKFDHVSVDTISLYGTPLGIAPLRPKIIPGFIRVTGPNAHIASGYTFVGSGKIGFQLLQDTYRLLLRGQIDHYTSIWVPLIEQMARKVTRTAMRIRQPFPYMTGSTLDIELVCGQTEPQVMLDNTLVPMGEDILVDDYWHGTFRTNQSGWHQILTLPDSATFQFYTHQPSAWQGIRLAQQVSTNLLRAVPFDRIKSPAYRVSQQIPPVLFFLVFLLSAGFLWLAPKL